MTWLKFSDCTLGYFATFFLSIISQDLLELLQKFLLCQLFVKPGQYYLVYFAVTILYFKAFLYCFFLFCSLGKLLREVYLCMTGSSYFRSVCLIELSVLRQNRERVRDR